jgi:DNA repair exonuclease SbcCD ATPase subunit
LAFCQRKKKFHQVVSNPDIVISLVSSAVSSYRHFEAFIMSADDSAAEVNRALTEMREKVAALEAEKRTLEAHVELLRMHNVALDARAEHVADLRAHAGVQQQHGDVLKAQHDSAMHELRLQHERAVAALDQQHNRSVTALTQQTELLQQLLQAKDRHMAALERQLEEKDKQLQAKDQQLQEKDKQLHAKDHELPELVKASLHSALDQNGTTITTRLAALEATIVGQNAAIVQAVRRTPEPLAGAPVTGENHVLGRRVKRGPSWKWEDQDGGVGSLGTLIAWNEGTAPRQNWCRVRWDAGKTNIYRAGAEKAHDLVYAE